jgi:ubiquinone/menaquinone biosynthesis C-methylase UbiE
MTPWTPEVIQKLLPISGETLRPGGLEITEQALRFCNFSKYSRILDAGCGTGATARYLRDRCEIRAFGIDLSAPTLAGARLRQGDLPLTRGDLESLPFREEIFDGITCECVLSNTSIPLVLQEFSRVLRFGGLLIVSDLYERKTGRPETAKGLRDAMFMPKEQLIGIIASSHFEALLWEDRTTDLKRLAARLIMKGVSFDEIFLSTGQISALPCRKENKKSWQNLGYYLLIARKALSDKGI